MLGKTLTTINKADGIFFFLRKDFMQRVILLLNLKLQNNMRGTKDTGAISQCPPHRTPYFTPCMKQDMVIVMGGWAIVM